MTSTKYLVTGATGETGKYTVDQLLQRGEAVRALVHKEDERADALRKAGAEVVVGDLLNHDDVLKVTAGIRAAYFCYPVRPGLIQATSYFADAAKKAGVSLVVNMSQISSREDSDSHVARDHWISERIFDWSGLPVTHLRPTFFSQWFLYPHSQASIIESGIIDLPYGEGRHAPIAAEDQARFIAELMENPAGHAGQTYELCGPKEMSQAEIADAIGEALKTRVVYEPLTIPEYRTRLKEQGLPDTIIQHFCAIATDYQNGIFAGSDEIIAMVTGKAPLTVQEFVKLHRAEFNVPEIA